MKWGLPCKIQPFLPKPTGDVEEDPNGVFDTMCGTSVSNVPACRLSDHTSAVHLHPNAAHASLPETPVAIHGHKITMFMSWVERSVAPATPWFSTHTALLWETMHSCRPQQQKHNPYRKEIRWLRNQKIPTLGTIHTSRAEPRHNSEEMATSCSSPPPCAGAEEGHGYQQTEPVSNRCSTRRRANKEHFGAGAGTGRHAPKAKCRCAQASAWNRNYLVCSGWGLISYFSVALLVLWGFMDH